MQTEAENVTRSLAPQPLSNRINQARDMMQKIKTEKNHYTSSVDSSIIWSKFLQPNKMTSVTNVFIRASDEQHRILFQHRPNTNPSPIIMNHNQGLINCKTALLNKRSQMGPKPTSVRLLRHISNPMHNGSAYSHLSHSIQFNFSLAHTLLGKSSFVIPDLSWRRLT